MNIKKEFSIVKFISFFIYLNDPSRIAEVSPAAFFAITLSDLGSDGNFGHFSADAFAIKMKKIRKIIIFSVFFESFDFFALLSDLVNKVSMRNFCRVTVYLA